TQATKAVRCHEHKAGMNVDSNIINQKTRYRHLHMRRRHDPFADTSVIHWPSAGTFWLTTDVRGIRQSGDVSHRRSVTPLVDKSRRQDPFVAKPSSHAVHGARQNAIAIGFGKGVVATLE